MKRNAVLVLVFVLGILPIFSQIINVPADQNTIQMAINCASNGDTVLVADGKYVENINFRGKTITVASHFLLDRDTSHISKTIIDGSEAVNPDSGSTVTMLLARDTTSVLCGFTIRGGTGTGPYEWVLDPEITTMTGGGIIHAGGKIINNIIQNNHISHTQIVSGGGIAGGMVQDIVSDTGVNIVIRDNIVVFNRIHSDEHYSGGGGIQMDLNSRLTIIENNIIAENICTTDAPYKAFGGGLNCGRLTSSTGKAIIRNNYIHHNKVHSEFSFAGGLFYLLLYDYSVEDFRPVEIYNNLIVENHSDYRGGGACFWFLGIWSSDPPVDPILMNNTILANYSKTGSGLCAIDAKVSLMNNILWNDIADEGGTEISDEVFNYCAPMPAWCRETNVAMFNGTNNNIQDGWPGVGNISLNPYLMEESFHLSDSSACVGRGGDSIQIDGTWYHAPSLDYYRNARPHPVDNHIDIGAIESPYEGYVYIPDSAFFAALIAEGVDINEDGKISYEEANAVNCINIELPSSVNIHNITGIEAFVNLDTLSLWSKLVDSVDISSNIKLSHLSIYPFPNTPGIGDLVCFKARNNHKLKKLILYDQGLQSLDISGCSGLIELNCSLNNIESLDLSLNVALEKFECSGNQLTNIHLANNTALIYLDCSGNLLTNMDISNNAQIEYLDLRFMPALNEVCVWTLPFPPLEGVDVFTEESPDIEFKDCSIAIIEKSSLTGISVFPNPAKAHITIEAANPDCYSLEIYSINGQLIYKDEMGGDSKEIDLTHFSKGIYFVTIRSDALMSTEKLIIY